MTDSSPYAYGACTHLAVAVPRHGEDRVPRIRTMERVILPGHRRPIACPANRDGPCLTRQYFTDSLEKGSSTRTVDVETGAVLLIGRFRVERLPERAAVQSAVLHLGRADV